MLTKDTISMLYGKLLGDGNISIQKGKKPRFRFSHCTADKEWCFFCYEVLKEQLPLSQPVYRKITDPRILKGYTEQYYVQSKTHPSISILQELWYPNGKKVLPFSLLSSYLTPLCLAWWYQDDGHLKVVNGNIQKIILSTDSFTREENQWLQIKLEELYGLTFSIDGQNRLILYDQPQILYFLTIIKPYMHDCMRRKIAIPSMNTFPIPQNKRTSFYLPGFIEITKPTNEINQLLENATVIESDIANLKMYREYIEEIKKLRQLDQKEFKSYQVVVKAEGINVLKSLRKYTGWSYGEILFLLINRTDVFNNVKRDPRKTRASSK